MKRKISLMLALVLMFTILLTACGKNEPAPAPAPTETGSEEPAGEGKVGGEIIVGNTTELSGDWVTLFQNNAADKDVIDSISGYATVAVDFEGEFLVDKTVVESYEVEENEDGTKTYTWKLNEDLVYDDGTPINAYDYAAGTLFWASKVIGDMGASNTAGQSLVGWKEYATGESKEFKGLRILDDYTLAVTISKDYLPNFFEIARVSMGPEKLSFWTDETVEVKDDGNGAYLSDNFTLENFQDRINVARREIPRPSTGPYVLKSYDEASKTAVLEINENYAGNFEGQKPRIQTIIHKKVSDKTQFDELGTGQVDLLTGAASGDDINEGLDLVEKGGFNFTEYPRAGYGKLMFICDFGPTEDVAVRQAIAHLLDRNDFATSFTGGFGSVVNGPYGEALWFYQEAKADLNSKVNQYSYSLEKAVEILEEAGWVYDASGNDYVSGIRHKKLEDGSLMPLELNWASTENNEVSELLVVRLQQNPDLEAAGIKINQDVMSFTELLNYMYRDATQGDKYGVPTYHMMNLASNFPAVYDRSNDYTIDPVEVKSGYNTNYILDEELDRLAKAMKLVDPEDRDGFVERFTEFIVRWNELLPDLPLYSNIYHDFYNEKLKDYNKTALSTLADTLLYAYVEE